MKSLKSKIRTPFLILIVVIPLLTLITFNIAVRAYVNRNARSELRAVAQTVETVAKGQLGSLRSLTPGNLDGAFVKLYRALHASRLAANTDMLLFSRERELLYPAEETGGLVGDALLEQVSKRLPTMEGGQVYPAFAAGAKYFLLAYPLTSLAGPRPTIVFVSEAAGRSS
jgi:hypothetical protein